MALIVGSAAVSIAPDMRGFLSQLQSKLRAEIASVNTDIPLRFVVDPASVAKAQAALGPLAAGKEVPLRFSVDPASTARARAALGPLGGQTVPIRFAVDPVSLARAEAAFRSATGILRGGSIPLNVDLNQASLARAQAQFQTVTRSLPNGTIPLKFDVNPAGLVAADTAVKALTTDTTQTGNAANTAYRGFGRLRGLIGARVPLFGGAVTVGAIHLLIDAIAEVAAIVVPTSVALGAFGVAAAPTISDIVQRMKNLYTISQALNVQMPGMTGAFSRMVDAVKPKVYSLFGDALDIIDKKGGEFQTLASQTGTALDRLGARFTLAITNGQGLSKMLAVGATDVAKLGDIVGNLGGTLGNVFKVLPGYATYLLDVADAGSKVLEWASHVAQPVIGFGLAAHGAWLYTGLLAGGLIGLYRSATNGTGIISRLGIGAVNVGTKLGIMGEKSLGAAKGLGASGTQIAKIADNLGGVIGPNGFAKVGAEAEGAAGKTGLLGKALGLVTKVPVWGWVAAGVAVLGGLAYWLARSKNATQQWVASLQDAIDKQKTFGGVVAQTATAQARTADAMTATARQFTANDKVIGLSLLNINQAAGKYNTLSAAHAHFTAEMLTEHTRLAQLAKDFGSTGNALGIFNKIGIKASDIAKANASGWNQDVQSAKGYLTAITELAGYQGGRALAAQRALTLAQSDQLAAVQQITQAEDQYISILTGGEQAFTTFAQYVKQTTKDENAGKVSASALAQAHSSLASAQSRVASAQSSLNGLQKSGTATSTQLHAAQARLASANANLAVVQGKVQTATHGTAVSLGGLNSASLTYASDFWSNLFPAAQKQIDALNAQFIGTKQLTKAVATIAGQMLPFAKGNDAARVAVMDLINNALGPGTVSMRDLNKWVGQNSTTMRGFKSIVDKSTVAASQLAKSLQNDLNVQFHQDLLAASGANGALKTYTADLVHNRATTAAGKADRAQLIKDLENAGLSAKQATNYVNNLSRSLGKIPAHEYVSVDMSGKGHYSIQQGQAYFQGSSAGHAVGGSRGILGGAQGAYVRAGTTPTADDVFARVSKGELIVPAKMVSAGLVDHLRGAIPGFANGGLVLSGNQQVLNGQYAMNMVRTFNNDMLKSLTSAMKSALATAAASSFAIPGAAAAGTGTAQAIARRLLAQMGWSNQWPALDMLWTRESGWRWNAQNPTSPAYGIPQADPGSKMAAAGSDWRTNPATQIRWGLGYIKSVYGDPDNAWANELAHGSYDAGGILPPGLTLAANRTGHDEMVLRPDQLLALAHSGGGNVTNYNITAPGASISDVRSAIAAVEMRNATKYRIGRPQ